MQTNAEKTEAFQSFLGAQVLWPPDMPDHMVTHAITLAQECLRELDPNTEGTKICERIKQEFDERYGKFWHVVCGKSFGCHAIHESQRFLYFSLGLFAFMLYKAS